MGERVLLAGGTEKSRELLQTLAAPGSWECCKLCHSGGETRRALGEGEWSLLIINTPLGDESGLELAMEAAGRTMAAVLLLVKAELADAVAARVEESGVMVVPKPVPRLLFDQALRFAMAARSRLTALRRENMRLEKKVEEMRLVDRAKCALIQYRGMYRTAGAPVPGEKGHGYAKNQGHGGHGGFGLLRAINLYSFCPLFLPWLTSMPEVG